MSKQVCTEVYCIACGEPIQMVDVVREGGYNWHAECLDKEKGSHLWTGSYEPDLA